MIIFKKCGVPLKVAEFHIFYTSLNCRKANMTTAQIWTVFNHRYEISIEFAK